MHHTGSGWSELLVHNTLTSSSLSGAANLFPHALCLQSPEGSVGFCDQTSATSASFTVSKPSDLIPSIMSVLSIDISFWKRLHSYVAIK